MHAAHNGSWLNPDPNNLEELYAIFGDKQHGHYEHRIAAYITLVWGERQMTVIAYFSTEPFPFFVSDMLLSKERRPGEVNDIYLPTVGNLRDFERFTGQGLPFIATRMVRKPFAVHGRRAYVAWAGPVAAGEILYKALFGLLEGDLEVEVAIDDAFSRLPLHY